MMTTESRSLPALASCVVDSAKDIGAGFYCSPLYFKLTSGGLVIRGKSIPLAPPSPYSSKRKSSSVVFSRYFLSFQRLQQDGEAFDTVVPALVNRPEATQQVEGTLEFVAG